MIFLFQKGLSLHILQQQKLKKCPLKILANDLLFKTSTVVKCWWIQTEAPNCTFFLESPDGFLCLENIEGKFGFSLT